MAERQLQIKPSSQVDQAFYDDETMRLRVLFKRGGEYHYSQVDEIKASEFESSDSPGSYLHQNVKGQHDFTKIG